MGSVVFAIISRKSNLEEEFLLISSKKDFGMYTGYYYPPGGHVEEGETTKSALIRELTEELRLEIKPLRVLGRTTNDLGEPSEWWSCEIVSGEPDPNPDEIADAKYFTRKQMSKLKVWPATALAFESFVFGK